MNTLLVDVGNARTKWALRSNGLIGELHAVSNHSIPDEIEKLLVQSVNCRPDAVAISNVADATIADAVQKAVANLFGRASWFARVGNQACGVRNGYHVPEQLGVDRWAAICAAYHSVSQGESSLHPVCVVDAGSALTIDVVTADGAHRGGLIVPGLQMAVRALVGDTRGITLGQSSASLPNAHPDALGVNTEEAIRQGSSLAAAALVDRVSAQFGQESGDLSVFLTGGDAEIIHALLQTRSEIRKTLVLEGLALLHSEQGQ